MSLSVSISGVSVDIQSIQRPDRIDEHSTCTVVVLDSTGTALYQKGNPITVTDSILGQLFNGYVTQAHLGNLYPNTENMWTLTCAQEGDYLASKRTGSRIYSNQYAGTIAVDQIQRDGAAEGLLARAALRWDELQSDWASGTLTNTIATTNASDANTGDGDLELALAGAVTTISIGIASDFDAGGYSNTGLVGGALQPTATPAIKLVANATLNNAGNLYTYVKIWNGSQLLGSGYYLLYDEWIDPASPEAKMAVDIVFSDGTTLRDNSVYNDSQNMAPHPNTDLTGLAVGQWYHRQLWLANLNGKTISYVTLACEGDKVGTYTGWFKNVKITDINFVTQLTVFNGTLNTSQQMQNYGYSSSTISVVQTCDIPFYISQGEGTLPWTSNQVYWVSQGYSIDAVKILQSSYISYNAIVPPGTLNDVRYTLDYAGSSTAAYLCTNNAALPNLPAGLNVAGRTINIFAVFYRDASASTLANPEAFPSLSSITLKLNPSYTMSKTDVQFACVQASDWTQAGTTLTNIANSMLSSKVLSLSGYVNNFDSSYGSTNLYSSGTPGVTLSNRTVALTVTTGTDAKLKLNDPGQYQNFTAECDVLVGSGWYSSLVYRTTNWGNSNDSYAYQVSVTPTLIQLGHGNNSTGAGSYTNISTVSLTLTSGNWHHLKIVANGSTHQIYLDDILFINATDATYAAAGYVGLRIYNASGSTQTAQFNNFGIVSALSGTWLSPSISLASATTYGTSLINWRDQNEDDTNCSIKVESSIDGGSTWATCTKGALLPALTTGQSLSGVNLQLRVTLTTTTASSMPGIDNLIVRILQQFSASGTRISPSLSLTAAGRAATALVNWNANVPANTYVDIKTSIDGGTSYQTVNVPGGAIIGIFSQPDPIEDVFAANSSASYLQSNFGGTNGTWTWDTANSRLTGSGGNFGTLIYPVGSLAVDNQITADFDQADGSGLLTNYTATTAGYFCQVWDASAGGTPNTVKLFRRSSSTNTQIGSTATINFVRGTIKRFALDVEAGIITVSMDGVQLIQYTDGSPLSAGQSGLLLNTLARAYSLRIQLYGQDVTSLSLLTKITLTSTDPTATPQVLDMQSFVSSADIGAGNLIPTADYRGAYLSDNINNLSQQSNYWTRFSGLYLVFQSRNAKAAPFVLATVNSTTIAGQQIGDILLDGLGMDNGGDNYRNRMIMKNAINGTSTLDVVRNNTGQFQGTISQSQMQAIENAAGGTSSGIVEAVMDASSMTTADALTLADQLLQRYGVMGRTFTPKTLRSGLVPGMQLALFNTAYGLTNTQTLITQIDVILSQSPSVTGGLLYAYKLTVTEAVNLGTWVKFFTNFLNPVSITSTSSSRKKKRVATNVLNLASTSYTGNGNSVDLPVGDFLELAVDVNISSKSGTSPTLQLFVDRKGADGVYYPVWQSSSITATGQVSTAIGAGMSIAQGFGSIARLRWVIGGTTPSWTFSASIIGK